MKSIFHIYCALFNYTETLDNTNPVGMARKSGLFIIGSSAIFNRDKLQRIK